MENNKMQVDVVIPVYGPDEAFVTQLSRLARQTVQPERIIIMNTDSARWEQSGVEGKLIQLGIAPLCELHHVRRTQFDHGGTRNLGVSFSAAPYFILMTQDALPINEHLIENLLRPLEGAVQMSYARQIPYRGADPLERFSRHFNYPEQSRIKSISDLPKLGIKTYFASNVCAAYERSSFDRIGGFTERTIFNEDMIYAAALLRSGAKIAYASDALVRHSHHYTAVQQFHRNFDLAVSQAEHPEVFAGIRSEGEGFRMVRETAVWLKRRGMTAYLPALFLQSSAKYLGYLLGKNHRRLPEGVVKRCSMNRAYWEKPNE